jgi:hypothetical protein
LRVVHEGAQDAQDVRAHHLGLVDLDVSHNKLR